MFNKHRHIKIFYIPESIYLDLPEFEFGASHFNVERYKEKRIIYLAKYLTRLSHDTRKWVQKIKDLPLNHTFVPEEFELTYEYEKPKYSQNLLKELKSLEHIYFNRLKIDTIEMKEQVKNDKHYLLGLTYSFTFHPEGYKGPCACLMCRLKK